MNEPPRLSRPQCAQDWEDRKDVIMELYGSKTLKETMRIMEEEHLFKATEKQYKTQLQKWDIDHKRIKPTEYKAMIRKKRQREEVGQKESKFELRGLEVDDAKIVRFQKRHHISEPEQVSDCPTPPDLICTTPAPLSIPPSPGLRSFPWYDIYERYLDLSMAGASTIQSNDLRSILHWLAVPFDDYEAQCRSNKDWERKSYQFVTAQQSVLLCPRLLWLDGDLRCGMLFLRIYCSILEMIEICRSQRLRTVVSKCVCTLDNGDHSLPVSDPQEQVLVFLAVRLAGTMYRESGRCDKAISLLETVMHLFGPDVDLKNAEVWFYYNIMLIELAHCCAEAGHQDEARDLLENKIKFPSTLRCRSHFDGTTVGLYRGILRRSRENALQSVGELENGRGGTRFKRERHARLQEGSSRPEASEWGPFLTDCMEWDKI